MTFCRRLPLSHLSKFLISTTCTLVLFAGSTVQAESGELVQDSMACNVSEAVFRDTEQAVQHLSICFYELSLEEDREYIAAILEEDGTLSVVLQRAESGDDEVTLRFQKRRSQTLTALWHTHGAPGSARNYFSEKDTSIAEQFGIPFYLTDPAGDISIYIPGQNNRGRARAGGVIPYGSVRGEKIGNVSIASQSPQLTWIGVN